MLAAVFRRRFSLSSFFFPHNLEIDAYTRFSVQDFFEFSPSFFRDHGVGVFVFFWGVDNLELCFLFRDLVEKLSS